MRLSLALAVLTLEALIMAVVPFAPQSAPLAAHADGLFASLAQQQILSLLPASAPGGIAVALRFDGRTEFLSTGPVDSDSLFNVASLRKPFEATLLARAVGDGRMRLDDPIPKFLPEISPASAMARVTVGQLATHTSGLLMPQDHPPWPTAHYTLDTFFAALNDWRPDPGHAPGRQSMYTHAGYIVLQLVLERALGGPIDELLRRQLFEPLGLESSIVPQRGADGRGLLPPPMLARAVQGYDEDGAPVGLPGDQQTYYDFPGTGQMFSTARDLLRFVDANMDEGSPVDPSLAQAMRLARTPVVPTGTRTSQGLAWEIDDTQAPQLVDKNGGLNNTSTYMGMMPARRIALVVLCSRGNVDVATAARRVIRLYVERHS